MRSKFAKFFIRKQSISIKDIVQKGEVTLLELLYYFLSFRNLILTCVIISVLLGIISICTKPKSYTAKSKILPENTNTTNLRSSGLKGLSKLIGLETEASTSVGSWKPESFIGIAANQRFLLSLMDNSIYFKEYARSMTLKEYFLTKDERSLNSRISSSILETPYKIMDIFQPNDAMSKVGVEADTLFRLSDQELGIMEILKSKIKIENGSVITLETTMPEAEASAIFNQIVLDELIHFVVEEQTRKERLNLYFVQNKVDSAKLKYEKAQLNLAAFRDQNQGIISKKLMTQEERLQDEYDLRFGIYNQLVLQLEKMKIELQERTPLISIFEPVYVPLRPTGDSILLSLVKSMIIGIILAILIVLFIIARDVFLVIRFNLKALGQETE